MALVFAVACGDGNNGDGGDAGAPDSGDAGPPDLNEIDCSEADGPTEVEVGPGLEFTPSDVTIDLGTAVKWTWASGNSSSHDVVADDDADCAEAKPSWFDSKRTKTAGHTFCVRFDEAGTWNYQCTVTGHCPNGMKGTVTVESP